MIAALVLLLLGAEPEFEARHRKVSTGDGASLALYSLRLASTSSLQRGDVLLVADFGFGRTLLTPLARRLAFEGYRVFVAELRGQGAADSAHSLQNTWAFDLPAVFAAVSKEAPGPVHLVVHGYAGSMVMAAVASGSTLQVGQIVALNTPVSAEPPTELLESFLSTGGRFSTLAASPEGFVAFEQLFTMGSRADRRSRSAVATLAARDLGRPLASELLAWMQAGDLPLGDGTSLQTRLRALDRPTLLMLALADAFAPTEACEPLRDVAKGPVTVRLFSRVAQGDDYAHASLFLGQRADQQVFTEIVEFLR